MCILLLHGRNRSQDMYPGNAFYRKFRYCFILTIVTSPSVIFVLAAEINGVLMMIGYGKLSSERQKDYIVKKKNILLQICKLKFNSLFHNIFMLI